MENLAERFRIAQNLRTYLVWQAVVLTVVLSLIATIIADIVLGDAGFAIRRISSNAVALLGLFLFLLWNKIPIRALGIMKKRAFSSLVAGSIGGIVFALIFLFSSPESLRSLFGNLGVLNPIRISLVPLVGVLHVNGLALLIAAMTEELIFRGFLLNVVLAGVNSKFIAIIGVATLFCFFHLDRINIPDLQVYQKIVATALLILWNIAISIGFFKFKNLLFPVAWHYCYNATIVSFVGINNI